MLYAVIGLAVVGGVEAVLLWRVIRGLGRLGQVEARVGHLTDALTLLTETMEAGFRASAQELSRVSEGSRKPAAAAPLATRRPARPVRKARPAPPAITPTEMSESEVHLRLHLAESGVTMSPKGGSRAALRA